MHTIHTVGFAPSSDAQTVIRDADVSDLDTVNTILTAAISGWGLAKRVLRLSLPSLRYNAIDLRAMRARLMIERGAPVGFSCSEPADPGAGPAGRRAFMLHGLYVLPQRQGTGIGTRLLADVEALARAGAYDSLATKAWRESCAFFSAQGFVPCEPATPSVWPLALWRAVD